MGLAITAASVQEIGREIWVFEMPPHHVRMFGKVDHSEGTRSVMLLKDAKYDAASATLQFDADNVLALNVGTLPYAIAIKSNWAPTRHLDTDAVPSPKSMTTALSYAPGDKEFLRLTSALSAEMQEAAKRLLDGVRRKSPGDLKRGQQRNFSNTPDNFWYVIVQPRLSELSITIRGEPNRFADSSRLELKVDRPGYTRFKITSVKDVDEALNLIFASKRKA